jgi:hypothetical protein
MATLDKATADRMGYDNVIAAETHQIDGVTYEFALIGPGDVYGDGYHLAVHVDCDPDRPTDGSSEMDMCGPNLDSATRAFDKWVAEIVQPSQNPSSPLPR